MKPWQHARVAAATTSSCEAPGQPNAMFASTVSLNRYTFWNTIEKFASRLSQVNSRTSWPPTRTLPALTGQVASIIKDSSLLSVIAVIELTQTIREITATNYNFFGGFLLLGALYLVLTLPIMAVSRHFEKRLSYA